MLHPSYTELMDLINKDSDEDSPVVGSRYSVVMAAAKRARQIIDGRTGLPEDEMHKPLSTAVQELWDGDIKIVPEDTDVEDENEIRDDMDKEIEGLLPSEENAEKLFAEEHPGEEDVYAEEYHAGEDLTNEDPDSGQSDEEVSGITESAEDDGSDEGTDGDSGETDGAEE